MSTDERRPDQVFKIFEQVPDCTFFAALPLKGVLQNQRRSRLFVAVPNRFIHSRLRTEPDEDSYTLCFLAKCEHFTDGQPSIMYLQPTKEVYGDEVVTELSLTAFFPNGARAKLLERGGSNTVSDMLPEPRIESRARRNRRASR